MVRWLIQHVTALGYARDHGLLECTRLRVSTFKTCGYQTPNLHRQRNDEGGLEEIF